MPDILPIFDASLTIILMGYHLAIHEISNLLFRVKSRMIGTYDT